MAKNLNDYLALVEKRKAENTIKLQMPSGFEWELKPINIEQLMFSGKLPTHIFAKLDPNAAQEATSEEKVEAMEKMMELTRDVMLSNLIFPRITPKPSKDSIGIDEVGEKIDAEDFAYFMTWLVAGAQAGQNLKSSAHNRGQKRTAQNSSTRQRV